MNSSLREEAEREQSQIEERLGSATGSEGQLADLRSAREKTLNVREKLAVSSRNLKNWQRKAGAYLGGGSTRDTVGRTLGLLIRYTCLFKL